MIDVTISPKSDVTIGADASDTTQVVPNFREDTVVINTRPSTTVSPPGTSNILRSYLAGLSITPSASTFAVFGGVAADRLTTTMMTLPAALTKTTDNWALGTAGSLDVGSIAPNVLYHVHLIQRSDSGQVDIALSTSATAPTVGPWIPIAYDSNRRIGSLLTSASSQFVMYKQNGDEFLWNTVFQDLNTAALGTTAQVSTLTVPTGVQVMAKIRAIASNASLGTRIRLSSLDEASIAGGSLVAGDISMYVNVANLTVCFTGDIRTNTLGQINTVASAAATTLIIDTYGYIDRRGKDA